MAVVSKSDNHIGEDVKKKSLISLSWSANYYSYCGNQFRDFSKIKNRIIIGSSYFTPGNIPRIIPYFYLLLLYLPIVKNWTQPPSTDDG